MSEEIPIGSPPAPAGRHAAPPGWYSDPLNAASERYWDGWQWSRTTRVAERPQAQGRPGGPNRPAPSPGGYPEPARWTPQSAAGHHQPGAKPIAGYGAPTVALTTEDGVPLSGWGARALAAVIDVLGIGLIGLLASLPFYLDFLRFLRSLVVLTAQASQRGTTPPSPDAAELARYLTTNDQLAAGVISGVIAVAYYALFWRFRSATVGQLICGLRVVPADTGQGLPRLDWNTVVVRALIWVLPLKLSWLVLFWALDCLSPLWNGKRQSLHDRAARTQVVKVR